MYIADEEGQCYNVQGSYLLTARLPLLFLRLSAVQHKDLYRNFQGGFLDTQLGL